MLPRFEADAGAAADAEARSITFFAGVPTMYWGLLGALKEAGDSVDVEKLAAQPAGRGRRRLGAAGRGAQELQGASSA